MLYKAYIKRIGDVILSGCILISLLPIFFTILILIKLESPGPVLFKQNRITKDKKTFNILKFRTMRCDAPKDIPTHLLNSPDQFITRIGKILRKTSLDELPQLINIIKGDMSIIGPRPALWNQDDLIAERDLYGANDILPGLTGWAQINGRDELPIPLKAKFDGEYAEKLNFLFDLKIFFLTIVKVLKRDDIA